MSLRPHSPRIAMTREKVPLLKGAAPGLAAAGILVLAVVGSAALGLGSSDTAFRLVMLALSLMLAVMTVAIFVFGLSVSPGLVRVDPASPWLRFAAPARVRALFTLGWVIAIIPAGITLATGASLTPTRGGVVALGVLGLVWVGQQAWSLRTPRGLTLSPDGMSGVRGMKAFTLRWDELDRAEAAWLKGAKLMLRRSSGTAIVIESRWTGSDPNLVAPIIEHFRANPRDRGTLADPAAALLLVEQATR